MNKIKVRWIGPSQHHHEFGVLEHGVEYEVPEDLGKAWCDQGFADPQTAEAHKVVKGGKKAAEGKE